MIVEYVQINDARDGRRERVELSAHPENNDHLILETFGSYYEEVHLDREGVGRAIKVMEGWLKTGKIEE